METFQHESVFKVTFWFIVAAHEVLNCGKIFKETSGYDSETVAFTSCR